MYIKQNKLPELMLLIIIVLLSVSNYSLLIRRANLP